MTLLIPLLLRLTALFERGMTVEEPTVADQAYADEEPPIPLREED